MLQLLPALVFAPFGIPETPFWIYACASALLIIGLVKILDELPREHGVDKIIPFGRLFFAIPLAVFASEHFTDAADIAKIVPRWIPAHLFWVYLIGLGFFCAAFSIVMLVHERLAAALVGTTFVIFVLVIDIPGVLANPQNRFSWALALRQLAFSGGAFALAMSPASRLTVAGAVPRFFVAIPSLFYGVQHLLHPDHAPGVPLRKLTPEWIPGRIFVSDFVGVVLIAAGVFLLLNRKARRTATFLGLTILLTVIWVYLPMLVAAPMDLVALNYFFDTLMFCGTILLLAGAMEKQTAVGSAPAVSLEERLRSNP